jgi:hypothetical protein
LVEGNLRKRSAEMEFNTDATRYFAIWRGNLRENWQEGFYEIQEADCFEEKKD